MIIKDSIIPLSSQRDTILLYFQKYLDPRSLVYSLYQCATSLDIMFYMSIILIYKRIYEIGLVIIIISLECKFILVL